MLSAFPLDVKRTIGFALRLVQNGETPEIAKLLKGFGGGVYEIKTSGADNTFRVVYLLRAKKGVYVIDAFVKKSKRGSKTPKEITERIRARLKCAKEEE
jgi:phage-related protein